MQFRRALGFDRFVELLIRNQNWKKFPYFRKQGSVMDSFGAWDLPEEYKILRDSVRRFMEKDVQPAEEGLPHDCWQMPEERLAPLKEKAKQMGLWCILSPEEHGGAGLNHLARAVVAEESARCRMGSYIWAGGAFGDDPPEVIWAGTREQIAEYGVPSIEGKRKGWFAISEPSGGSDPARAIRTRAVRDGDSYILNGQKTWITAAGVRDWGVVFARTGDGGDRGGITCFIIDNDNPGVSFSEIKVIRSYSPYDVFFTDCRVPVSKRVGEEGQGFSILRDFLGYNRIPYTANCIGTAQSALEMAIEWAQEREVFGSPLADKQAIQWMIADSEIELQAARLLVYQAAWAADMGEPFITKSSMAKVFGTETAGRVVDRCIQIFGGLGVTQAMPLERWLRELRIKRIGEGPSEVHRMVVARELLGRRS